MAEVSFANYSALVIDDETFTRAVLVRMLNTLGFKAVFQAEDGSSGIAVVAAHAPQVIICDIQMKPMDGVSFLRNLRQEDADPNITAVTRAYRQTVPVVLITGRRDPVQEETAARLGCHGFLVKPVTPAQLKPLLNICLLGNAPPLDVAG